MSITERMKKYAFLLSVESMTSKTEKQMLTDLQTAMRALEVARDSLKYHEREYNSEPCDNLMAKAALEAINNVLGEK